MIYPQSGQSLYLCPYSVQCVAFFFILMLRESRCLMDLIDAFSTPFSNVDAVNL